MLDHYQNNPTIASCNEHSEDRPLRGQCGCTGMICQGPSSDFSEDDFVVKLELKITLEGGI